MSKNDATFEIELSAEDMEKLENLVSTGNTAGNEFKIVFAGNPEMMGCGGNGCAKRETLQDRLHERKDKILSEAYIGPAKSDENGEGKDIFAFTKDQISELDEISSYWYNEYIGIKEEYDNLFEEYMEMPEIPLALKILRSGRATIVFWADGTKTVVKRAEDEKDSVYAAFTAALGIKIFGSNSQLSRFIKSKIEYQEVKKEKTPTAEEQERKFWQNLGFTSCSTTTMKHEGETYAES